MSEITLNNSPLRISYNNGENFIDIKTEQHWWTQIGSLDHFNYWVVVKMKDEYSQHRVICVPNKDYFKDWVEIHKDRFEVVYAPTEQKGKL